MLRINLAFAGAAFGAGALALSSFALVGCTDDATERSGAAPAIDAPSLRTTDSPCDDGADEYIDPSGEEIICGPTEPGEPWPEEPPCAQLPGGCFPEPEPPEPPDPGGGGGGGGEEPGFCSSYNTTFQRTETRNYPFPMDPFEQMRELCPAAASAATQACQNSAGLICAASASAATYIEYGCDTVVNGRRDCYCTQSVYCSYTSRI
ncbi:MAG TPA: hypothetical protein VFS00_05775 [Polyangiaceae bacterium]|nr:hypothetical protein [Polyangiaceae bacterium]